MGIKTPSALERAYKTDAKFLWRLASCLAQVGEIIGENNHGAGSGHSWTDFLPHRNDDGGLFSPSRFLRSVPSIFQSTPRARVHPPSCFLTNLVHFQPEDGTRAVAKLKNEYRDSIHQSPLYGLDRLVGFSGTSLQVLPFLRGLGEALVSRATGLLFIPFRQLNLEKWHILAG